MFCMAMCLSCKKDDDDSSGTYTVATVKTNNVTDITLTSAVCGGEVTSDGGAVVIECGVCWGTSQNPTMSESHTIDGGETDSFTSSITGLTANTTYYVRAYATNSKGTSYGEQKSFTTQSGVDGADIDITINPTTLQYQELNTVGGWMYLTAREPSRGLIVYRFSMDEFRAYDRKPPYNPDECGETTRLIVDFPFVVDECHDFKYNIIDGSIIEGDGRILYYYNTSFDGTTLKIWNETVCP